MNCDTARLLAQQTELSRKLEALEELNVMLIGVVEWFEKYVEGNKGLIHTIQTDLKTIRAICSDLPETGNALN